VTTPPSKGLVVELYLIYFGLAQSFVVAIFGEGSIICCGTSLFLKTKFGGGLKLNLELSETAKHQHTMKLFDGMEYEIMEETKSKIKVEIPFGVDHQDLFRKLDNQNDDYGIYSYSLNDSSLEDVFLKVSNIYNSHLDVQE
jgi:ATP-binding cassette subfamily A (ABC1) protein 3